MVANLKKRNKLDDEDSIPDIDNDAIILLNRYALLYAEELTMRCVRECSNLPEYEKTVRDVATRYKKEIVSAVRERIKQHKEELHIVV